MDWLLLRMRGVDDGDDESDGDVVMMMSSNGRTGTVMEIFTSLVTEVTGNRYIEHTYRTHRYVHKYGHGLLSKTDRYRK
jgi:hypothetical protein